MQQHLHLEFLGKEAWPWPWLELERGNRGFGGGLRAACVRGLLAYPGSSSASSACGGEGGARREEEGEASPHGGLPAAKAEAEAGADCRPLSVDVGSDDDCLSLCLCLCLRLPLRISLLSIILRYSPPAPHLSYSWSSEPRSRTALTSFLRPSLSPLRLLASQLAWLDDPHIYSVATLRF